jgi:predicted DNA-binding protein YlxM (UPF0122 family)
MKLAVKPLYDAIYQKDGNISEIARAFGVSRSTVYRKIEKHDSLQEALADARESFIDFAESKLRTEVKKGNITAIIFTLKTLGKHRGYVERQEITGKDGGKLEIEYVNDWRNAKD